MRTTANERSFNNEQGMPITILNAPDDTEVLVLEMGMRGFGEISSLCEVARPEIGVVTAVGHSHTERVGGIEGVAKAKRELVEALPKSGTAVLNADDHRVAAMAAHTGAAVSHVRPERRGPHHGLGARRVGAAPLPAGHTVGNHPRRVGGQR